MTDKLLNWAIFGVVSVLWVFAFRWASAEGHSAEAGMLLVSLITMSLISGKTSGDNGIAHVIDGLKGGAALLIGWIIASVVHDVVSGLVYTQSVDAMGVLNGAIDVVAIVVASVIMFSSVNAVRA